MVDQKQNGMQMRHVITSSIFWTRSKILTPHTPKPFKLSIKSFYDKDE